MQKFQNKSMQSIMNSAKKVNSVMNSIDGLQNGKTWWDRSQSAAQIAALFM